MREASSIIYDFYHWIEKPLKSLSFFLRRNCSEYRDMNGRKCFVGDTIIHHKHDPSQRGTVCKYDVEYVLEHDDWGRVRGGSNYLWWLMEKKG